jgi:general secretion pathway protein D
MKKLIFSLIFFLSCSLLSNSKLIIERLDVREGKVSFVTKVLSEATDFSIISTEEAGEIELPPLLLKNRNFIEVISVICNMANIAYSYDNEMKIYTLKTLEEYQEDLYYSYQPRTHIFPVDPLNLMSIGQTLEDLYPDRLTFSEGYEIEQDTLGGNSGSGSGSQNNNRFNRNDNNDDNDRNNRDNDNNRDDNFNGEGGGSNNLKGKVHFDITPKMVLKIERIKTELKSDYEVQTAIDEYINNFRHDEPEIYVTLNQEHSHIIVRTADTKALKDIEEYIKANNIRVPQVLLEMKILELTIGDDFSSVFDYSIDSPFDSDKGLTDITGTGPDFLQLNPGNTFSQDNSSFIRGASTFAYEVLSSNVAARIEVLKRDNLVETLATPMLISANNRIAEIKIVQNDIFVTGFEFEDAQLDDNNNVVIPAKRITNTNEEDVGLTLRIKPLINDDNTVTLTVYQEDSSKIADGASIPLSEQGGVTDLRVDIKSEKTISSTVKAKDKMTVAIGGQIRSENVTTISKVPVLGDIPLLGYFFRDEVTNNVKKELVLLITPHIMYDETVSEDTSHGLINRVSDHKFHEGDQEIIDNKNGNLIEYRKDKDKPIRDFVKETDQVIDNAVENAKKNPKPKKRKKFK